MTDAIQLEEGTAAEVIIHETSRTILELSNARGPQGPAFGNIDGGTPESVYGSTSGFDLGGV